MHVSESEDHNAEDTENEQLTQGHIDSSDADEVVPPRILFTRRTRSHVHASMTCIGLGVVLMILAPLLRVIIENALKEKMEAAALIPNPDRSDDDGKDQFEAWKRGNAEDDDGVVYAFMHLYHYENPSQALSAAKPVVREVGPYVFRQKWRHFDIHFSADDTHVTYKRMLWYEFDQGLSGSLKLTDQIAQPWVGYLEVLRQTGLSNEEQLTEFLITTTMESLWLDWMRRLGSKDPPVTACVTTSTRLPLRQDDFSAACWDLMYQEWGSGSSGVQVPGSLAPFIAGYAFHYNQQGYTISPADAERLLRGPYGLLKFDVEGQIQTGFPFAFLFLELAATSPATVQQLWQVDSTQLSRLVGYLQFVKATVTSVMNKIIKDGGGESYEGRIAVRTAQQWLFNFQDPLAATLGITKNAAYFLNHTSERGNDMWSADLSLPTTIHTGKDSRPMARQLVTWHSMSVLPQRTNISGYWCGGDVPVQGKESSQVFLQGTEYDDVLTALTTFETWDEDVLQSRTFSFGEKSSLKGIDTWRFESTEIGKTDTNIYGPTLPGMLNVTCPLAAVPLYASFPRYARAQVPAALEVQGVPAANPATSRMFYDIEPRSGAAIAGTSMYMLSAVESLNSSTGSKYMLPLMSVRFQGSLSDSQASAIKDAFEEGGKVFTGLLHVGLSILLLAGLVLLYLVAVRRRKESAAALEEFHAYSQDNAAKESMTSIYVFLLLHVLVFSMIAPVLPLVILDLYDGDFPAASLFYSWITAIAAVLQFLTNPVFGSTSDALGRKPFITLSAVGLVAQMLLIGSSLSRSTIIFATIIRGITDCAFTIGTAVIADLSDPQHFAKNFGFVGACVGIALTLGPLLGSAISASGNVRFVFLVAGGIELLNLIYVRLSMKESLHPSARHQDITLKQALCSKKANPFRVFKIFTTTEGLKYSFVVFTLNTLATTVVFIWFLYTKYVFGWGVVENGLFLFWFGIVQILSQGFALRPLQKRFGDAFLLKRGFWIHSAMYALLGLAWLGWQMYVILLVTGIGVIVSPIIRAIATAEVDITQQGKLQGSLAGVSTLCSVVGPLMMGGAFAYFVSDSAPFKWPGIPFFVAMLLNVIAALFIPKVLSTRRDYLQAHDSEQDTDSSANVEMTAL